MIWDLALVVTGKKGDHLLFRELLPVPLGLDQPLRNQLTTSLRKATVWAATWIILGASASPSTAQEAEPGPAEAVAGWVARESVFHAPHQPDSALHVLRAALEVHPGEYDLLWRACSEALTVAMLETDEEAREAGYAAAVSYGRAAVDADSTGTDGRAWLAAALGRYALDQGARTRVQLANEIYRLSSAVVADDPSHNLGQHVLGQWHAEIRRSGRFTRFLARRLLGGDTFSRATWEDALIHLQAAATAEPRALIHGLELARVYVDLDQPELARAELERILALPDAIATDPERRLRAEVLLAELD